MAHPLYCLGALQCPAVPLLSVLLALYGCSQESGSTDATASETDAAGTIEPAVVVVPSLQDDSRYQWRVRALSRDGAGPWQVSDPFTATAPSANGEAASVAARASADSDEQDAAPGARHIQWTPVVSADGYEVVLSKVSLDPETADSSQNWLGREIWPADSLCRESLCQVSLAERPDATGASDNLPPVAALNHADLIGEAPWDLVLDATDSIDPDGEIVRYQWTLEDRFAPFAEQDTLTHSVLTPGEYTLTLTVFDVHGASDQASVSFQVTAPAGMPVETLEFEPSELALSALTPIQAPSSASLAQALLQASQPDAAAALPEPDTRPDNAEAPAPNPFAPAVPEPDTVSSSDNELVIPETQITEPTVIPGIDTIKPPLALAPEALSPAVPDTSDAVIEQPTAGTDETAATESDQPGKPDTDEAQAEAEAEPTDWEESAEPVVTETAEVPPAPGEIGETLEFLDVKLIDAQSTSLTIEFSLNANATGRIAYGTAPDALIYTTAGEDSFRFSTHRQTLRDLQPGADYHFQVASTDMAGNQVSSQIQKATTLPALETAAEPVVTEPAVEPEPVLEATSPPPVHTQNVQGWPSNANEDLMMSGVFYGVTHGGLQTGNTKLAVEHSFRFRAEKTASITALRWENRLLTQGNVDNRSRPGYSDCRKHNLKPNVCAYLLGNTYHVGNGGRIVATIHPDNGDGKPDESIELGKVAKVYTPGDHSHNAWIVQEMQQPVSVVAGGLYHVVLKNLAPPEFPLQRNSVEQAKAKDPNTGAISLNGTWHGEHVGPDSLKWGPYYGRKGQAAMYRNSTNGSWSEAKATFGWLEFRYDDGVWTGETMTGYDNVRQQSETVHWANLEGFKIVGGNIRARQNFVVQNADRVVNGLWLNFSHAPTANLSSLTVELKDESGQVLARGSIAASREARSVTQEGMRINDVAKINAKTWGYTDLSETRLSQGKRYYLELSAASGAGFHIGSFYTKTDSNRNEWREAKAEVNKGNGWQRYEGTGLHQDRDLPILFTLQGMPKQLP